jgi:hypothetical protein
MLNLFQHLVVSMGYETLKQVQGDIPVIYTQTLITKKLQSIRLLSIYLQSIHLSSYGDELPSTVLTMSLVFRRMQTYNLIMSRGIKLKKVIS